MKKVLNYGQRINKPGTKRVLPASEKQLQFLRDLGIEPAEGLTIRQAAVEISLALVNNRKVEKYISAAMNYDLDE